MKIFKISFLIAAFFIIASCKKDSVSRINPDGDLAVNFDFPVGEVFAPAKVLLTNRSKHATAYEWQFKGGKKLTAEGIMDESTATGVVPDTILYEIPGTYEVVLTVTQDGKKEMISKQLVVKKQKPEIISPANILFLQEVEFSASVFKYPGKDVSYQWDFGNGMTSTAEKPKVTFNDAGNYLVTLTINDGEETLVATTSVNVQGELVKALFFTDVKTGKLYKQFFTQNRPSAPVQLPTAIGLHPLSLSITADRIVISDAGANISYAASALADGRIFSVDLNGGAEKTITRASGVYTDDPFASAVDNNGNVWWLSRNTGAPGMRSISLSATEATYPAQKFALTAAQAGVGSVFGWIDGGIQIVNNEIWFTKHGSAGRGMYKMSTTGQFIEVVAGLKDVKIKSFAVDTKNNKIYFVVNFLGGGFDKGFYVSNMDGTNIRLIDAMASYSTEGGANEMTTVTSIAIDNNPDDGTAGYVYYGYRDATDVSATGVVIGTGNNSGVKRYALSGDKPAEFYIKGFIPYGIAIDHVKRGAN